MAKRCQACRLSNACQHFKTQFCPLYFYVLLIALIAIPAYLIISGLDLLNI
ncbi:MAG: hypothetical protein OQK78_00475 [Gammaproteobacteria bacterium]|nr:hypothetical protein [Gammaproteobacteria bacterium]MCW8888826.1 hypothetical protein [Gammaproteobacteria bacterium]